MAIQVTATRNRFCLFYGPKTEHMKTCLLLFTILSFACSNEMAGGNHAALQSTPMAPDGKEQHWEGAFTNGMKQTYISFDVSADGKQLKNLTFKGYWYCDGKLTQDILGPEKSFVISNKAVDGVITEPEDGGATAIRYELKAKLTGNKAEGTFRMNINALNCDTRVLTWTASKKP